MSKDQKKVFLLLALIGAVYFALFVYPNLQGAKDANMLAVFETDEYGQYPNLLHMLTPGETFFQTIHNFAVYQHYFYGYPFYFFSALTVLPLRLILGADWTAATPFIILVLRQVINVLPMILAVGLLVWMQTRFKPAWLSIALFVFLLFVPALVVNNFWWHPDSLLVLFVVLTLFFLDRDDQRFGRNFFLAAAACGLATGTKHLGLFFFLAIPAYIAWGWMLKKIRLGRAFALAGLFVVVMVAAIVISNPLLLLPIERSEILAVQKLQWQQTNQGYWTKNLSPSFQWGQYPEDFRLHYGELFFLLLSIVGLGLGLLRKDRRVLHILILTWIVPFTYYFLVIAATRRTHYFLPVALPLFSCLANLFSPLFSTLFDRNGRAPLNHQILRIGRWAGILLLIVQSGLFLWQDGHLYVEQVTREQTSPSLAFFKKVDAALLSKMNRQPLVIYHDWKVYVPQRPHWQVEMRWDLGNYLMVDDLHPDVILLERDNLVIFAQDDVVQNALNPGNVAAMHQFYGDAAQNQLKGYHLVLQDSFGMAFVRDGL